jgi:hypothetical protein
MGSRGPTTAPGALLELFLAATDEVEAQHHLEQLLKEHADPIIRIIIQRKWGSGSGHLQAPGDPDAEDVHSEVIAQLLGRLRGLRTDRGGEGIGDFPAYVAVAAYHACDRHLRRKYPQRWSLKSRLRYLLTHQDGLAVWADGCGEWLAGFAAWRGAPEATDAAGRLQTILDAPQTFVQASCGVDIPQNVPPAQLLAAIFDRAHGPIALDGLVALVAELWGVSELALQSVNRPDALPPAEEQVPDPGPDVATQVDQRTYLRHVWDEIRQLPPRQAAALLLNLRDAQGRGVIALLPLMGVATLRQIAEALEMPAERFAALWNDLPIEDARIAESLGVTRQQIINLRKVARERLARRMKAGGY